MVGQCVAVGTHYRGRKGRSRQVLVHMVSPFSCTTPSPYLIEPLTTMTMMLIDTIGVKPMLVWAHVSEMAGNDKGIVWGLQGSTTCLRTRLTNHTWPTRETTS